MSNSNNKVLLSICIPSYNRPNEIKRLLESIDIVNFNEIEIIVCEDNSPLRNEISKIVRAFTNNSKYMVRYYENSQNYGYDRNLRELIQKANGDFVMFMGDDDSFIANRMDDYLKFLKQNFECSYILRSYVNNCINGSFETFTYYNKDMFFKPGVDSYIELFDKSVFISGFCIKKEHCIPFLTNELDGSLLFQLYLLAEICLRYPSAYYNTPITQAFLGNSIPYFGSSKAEEKLYSPGQITTSNSINFLKKYFELIKYVDSKNNINSLSKIRRNLSKYSYPSLAIHYDKGKKEYKTYIKELRLIGMDSSIYFEIYNFGLNIFGIRNCNNIIMNLKRLIGHRPKLY